MIDDPQYAGKRLPGRDVSLGSDHPRAIPARRPGLAGALRGHRSALPLERADGQTSNELTLQR
jgi:hypothetical protein